MFRVKVAHRRKCKVYWTSILHLLAQKQNNKQYIKAFLFMNNLEHMIYISRLCFVLSWQEEGTPPASL